MRQGQLLAYLRPSLSAGERASQQAELAELHINEAAQAARQLARVESLARPWPRDIDAQRAEAASLRQRAAALAAAGGRLACAPRQRRAQPGQCAEWPTSGVRRIAV